MSTYAAYYNLTQADKAAKMQASRRSSDNSATSSDSTVSQSSRRSSIKKVLNQLRPTEETITPSGIYTPIIQQGPLFKGWKPAKKAEEPTGVYHDLVHRDRPLFGRSKREKAGKN